MREKRYSINEITRELIDVMSVETEKKKKITPHPSDNTQVSVIFTYYKNIVLKAISNLESNPSFSQDIETIGLAKTFSSNGMTMILGKLNDMTQNPGRMKNSFEKIGFNSEKVEQLRTKLIQKREFH